MIQYYIVVFDRDANKGYGPFHDAFVGHAKVSRWWHYIKSCYIIGTELDKNDLSNHFTQTAKQLGLSTTHLVMKVDLRVRQGILTKDAWDWIQKNAKSGA